MIDDEHFEQHRDFLRKLVYRMVGTLADAEDVVQETYLKWRAAEREAIVSPRAWLVKVASRLALDHLKLARVRREQYVGPWLPEPLVEPHLTPADQMALDESVSMALLTMLERLSPAERAALLLHDIFQFSFDEVADILDKTPQACRKLASRARSHVQADKPRLAPNAAEHRRLTEAFGQAVRSGELEALQALLQEEVALHSDGGGKVQAARKVLTGRQAVAGFLLHVWENAARRDSVMRFEMCWFNGAPGWLLYEADVVATAVTFSVKDGLIEAIYAVRNPEKLVGFGR